MAGILFEGVIVPIKLFSSISVQLQVIQVFLVYFCIMNIGGKRFSHVEVGGGGAQKVLGHFLHGSLKF